MLSQVGNLRASLPDYDTPELRAEWKAVLDRLEAVRETGVPHAMGLATRSVLVRVIRAMGAKSVLDVGTSTGTSALAFALAVGEGGRVVSLDIRDANAPDAKWKQRNRPHSPERLMRAAGVADRVTFLTVDSRHYLRSTTDTFDFISLDGGHRESVVFDEIPLALARLNPGGLVFLDDMHPPGFIPNEGCDFIPGPWRAAQRWLQRTPELALVHPVDNLPIAFMVKA